MMDWPNTRMLSFLLGHSSVGFFRAASRNINGVLLEEDPKAYYVTDGTEKDASLMTLSYNISVKAT